MLGSIPRVLTRIMRLARELVVLVCIVGSVDWFGVFPNCADWRLAGTLVGTVGFAGY